MDVGRRRTGGRSNVVAGSVWESRMKLDEVKGGIKVFNGEENGEEGNGNSGTKMKRGQSTSVGPVPPTPSGKRKTWKSDSFDRLERNPIQIAKDKDKIDSPKNSEQHCKELSVDADGIKKSVRKLRSEGNKELGERSPVGLRKLRSESFKDGGNLVKEVGEYGNRIENNPAQLRKVKSDSVKMIDYQPTKNIDDDSGSEIQLSKAKSEPKTTLYESEKGSEGGSNGELEKNQIESDQSGSDETVKEVGVCQEKGMPSSLSDVKMLDSTPKASVSDSDGDGDDDEEDMEEEDVDEEYEVEIEKKSLDIKEVTTPEQKANKVINEKKVVNEVQKLHYERKEEEHFHHLIHARVQPSFTKSNTSAAEYHSFPETHNRLQSFVDLIMWKDISRSVFIFGIGTFIVLSSSYTKDINISFISVISYMGLVYLAAIFLFRSIIYRGVMDIENTSYVVGEEEATWLLKLILPYINEFLLKLKALFSGDPSTTMKLAVLLFVLARCGSFITIWTMAKLGFYGVFTVPKVCSLYSSQITAYAKFWVRRFRDAWDSCSHKKAVTVAVFLLVWNLSSIVARTWAAFMLYVAFRYYQQKMVADDGWEEEEDDEMWHESIGEQKQGSGPTFVDIITKEEKGKKLMMQNGMTVVGTDGGSGSYTGRSG